MDRTATGHSLLELVTVLAVVGLLASVGWGPVRAVHHRNRVRMPIRRLVLDLQRARVEAMVTGRRVGLMLWGRDAYRLCRDGDGDGIRAADLRSGTDPCDPRVRRLTVPGALRTGYLPQQLPNLPPRRGRLARGGAVRWGRARGLICNAWGVCSSGRVCWVETGAYRQWCLVIQGHTGRLAIWQYVPGRGWRRMPFL